MGEVAGLAIAGQVLTVETGVRSLVIVEAGHTVLLATASRKNKSIWSTFAL